MSGLCRVLCRTVCRDYVGTLSGLCRTIVVGGITRWSNRVYTEEYVTGNNGTMPGVRRDYVGIASGLCRGYVGFRPPLCRVQVQAKEA